MAGVAGTLVTAGWLAARLVRRVEVRGQSMRPALEPGDRLLCVPAWRLRLGDVVVLAEPGGEGLRAVKRVTGLVPGGVVVHGDNASASRDSRAYGPVPRAAVLGRAWWRYHPAGRVGRLPVPPGPATDGGPAPA